MVCCLFPAACLLSAEPIRWSTRSIDLEIQSDGTISKWVRKEDSKNYLAAGQPAPLMQLRIGGVQRAPSAVQWNAGNHQLEFAFGESGVRANVNVEQKEDYLTFELLNVVPLERVDRVQWGPIPTTIRATVGEVVGVVRDSEFAFGIQALNPKTLGGVPENEEGNTDRPYAAAQTGWGSVLQAYSIDRSRPRLVDVWNKRAPKMPVPVIASETVLGSKIALFGSPVSSVLKILGQIEVDQGLPHPLVHGVWAKDSPERGRSYLIASFSESDVDEILGFVKRANLMSLYHGGPFKTWGHYELHPKYFPGGVEGLRSCVQKANAQGIRIGVHTLSNFIPPADAYVSPVPDARLVQTGSSRLTAAIDDSVDELVVEAPEYFAQQDRNELRTVVVEGELIRYRSVSTAAPWRLVGCERGAFGTHRGAHAQGASVSKLMDHGYKVFLADLDLQKEIARRLADLFNQTGISHLDFDGHEGCLAAGQGTYGNEVFAKEFFDHVKGEVINGTSPPLSHFYWHINTYCNWGEPWYGGFRDSMQEYRINNQSFCERNYLPKMLGWYLLTTTTTLSDMEWMLARAAGYNAGFALATSPNALRNNPQTGVIMDGIREWEQMRREGVMPSDLREALKDPKREFHLETRAPAQWNLIPFHASSEFRHEELVRQPGEPTAAIWDWINRDSEQDMQFKIKVTGNAGTIVNPSFEVNRSSSWTIPAEIAVGQTLLVEEDRMARIYDAKGNQVRALSITNRLPRLLTGTNHVEFQCEFQGSPTPQAVVSFKTRGIGIHVQSSKP